MIRYLSPFKAQALAAGSNIAYVVPANTVTQVRALTFHNTTSASKPVEVYALPPSTTEITDKHRLIKKTLGQNESYLCPEIINHVLTEGMSVVLVGEGVNAMLSVAEQPT